MNQLLQKQTWFLYFIQCAFSLLTLRRWRPSFPSTEKKNKKIRYEILHSSARSRFRGSRTHGCSVCPVPSSVEGGGGRGLEAELVEEIPEGLIGHLADLREIDFC